MTPTVSLIISTYNRPKALRLVLEAVARQTVLPVEVVVGDDGSGEETRRLVEETFKTFPTKLVHVWQEDRGFRLAEIRNKSVAASSGEYIIQIDGDIVPDCHFVADHLRLARRGAFAKGTRVMLDEEVTLRLENKGTLPERMPGLLSRGIMKNRLKTLRLPAIGFRKSHTYKTGTTGIGANMAFFREDFLRVNGYDENFTGWGAEDTDLMERMLRAGMGSFKTFHVAKAYHLYHPESVNPKLAQAYEVLAEKARRGETECKNGISKWLNQK
ncbi:MAG: glycosyltransferase family 2 protein [Muribaculaceae bacterium]|nr:glycosyltransferase family 2 protein [Muribaculaceae bacterium]